MHCSQRFFSSLRIRFPTAWAIPAWRSANHDRTRHRRTPRTDHLAKVYAKAAGRRRRTRSRLCRTQTSGLLRRQWPDLIVPELRKVLQLERSDRWMARPIRMGIGRRIRRLRLLPFSQKWFAGTGLAAIVEINRFLSWIDRELVSPVRGVHQHPRQLCLTFRNHGANRLEKFHWHQEQGILRRISYAWPIGTATHYCSIRSLSEQHCPSDNPAHLALPRPSDAVAHYQTNRHYWHFPTGRANRRRLWWEWGYGEARCPGFSLKGRGSSPC